MEIMMKNLLQLTKWNTLINAEDNEWGYAKGTQPFIDYLVEDKSEYKLLSESINNSTKKPWIDKDDDFLVGYSGGILMKIDFVFIGTDIFSRVADFYDKHGKYTLAKPGSLEYEDFWKRETRRRRVGVCANCKLYIKDIPEYFDKNTSEERKKKLLHPLRITGDHYNYLNYGRIERVPNEKEMQILIAQGAEKVKTIDGFPRFWDGDYWNFKVDELIASNYYNLCKAKARRKGFSYKRGSQAANTLNLNKSVTVILAADQIEYLTDKGGTSYMTKTNLDWFETQTNWARGYLSESFDKGLELGYKKSKGGQKAYGFRSKLLSLPIGRNASSAIGKKAIEIDIEEAGKCKNLQNFINLTLSNLESGGIKIGTLRVYGTAGEKDVNWADFAHAFYNPSKNDMLAFENVWDKNARHKTCGFFFPQLWCHEPFVVDGNSLVFSAWKDVEELKIAKRDELSTSEYIVFCGQRANSPSEAFVNTVENMFMSPELNQHINDLKTDAKYHYYTDGWYVLEDSHVRFLNSLDCIHRGIFGGTFHDFILDVPHKTKTDTHGCVREYYPPTPNQGDLYFISADAYRVDKERSLVTDKHSLFSFKVWTYNNSGLIRGKKIVAEYAGRLNTMEENDRLLLYAALRYNAKVLVEAGTGETVSNFKKWGYRHLLLKDPMYYIDRKPYNNATELFGIVIGDGDKKLEGLRMIKDFIYEIVGYDENGNPHYRLQDIDSLPLLLELQQFEAGKNWDRISDMVVAMYEFKKDSFKKEKEKDKRIITNHQSLFNRLNSLE